jgi:hypothetical protein
MLEIKRTIDIDALVDDVWRTLAKFDDVSTWSHAVTKAHFSSSRERGVGAERVCEVSGLGTLIEQVVHWTEGETLAYEISGMPSIVRSAECSWHVERKNHFQTTLTVVMVIETRLGAIGALMGKSALAPQLGAALGEAVVQFKQYVETGRPLPGHATGLIQARAV